MTLASGYDSERAAAPRLGDVCHTRAGGRKRPVY
jgi:hypothetical protein